MSPYKSLGPSREVKKGKGKPLIQLCFRVEWTHVGRGTETLRFPEALSRLEKWTSPSKTAHAPKKKRSSTLPRKAFFFLSNACYRTSVFWYHYLALLLVVHLNRISVLFDDTPFGVVIIFNSEYYNRSTVQCILQIRILKGVQYNVFVKR